MLDGQIEALLQEREIKAPALVCGSGHTISRFCINEQCSRDSLCCGNEQCHHCSLLHEECLTGKLKLLTKKVQERLSLHKKILRSLFSIENELMNRLIANRKEIVERSRAWRFQGNFEYVIDSIYSKNNTNGLKGKDLKKLFDELSDKSNQQILADQYLQSYKAEGQKMVENLEKLRSKLIQNLGRQNNEKGKFEEKGKKIQMKAEGKIQIPSKILAEDQFGQQKYSFMLKQLNNPTSLKLLFRASQHNFAVSKFHECCDGISDTVNIVRTEFGKTIAAYTPLKWSSSFPGEYVADDSKRSFLLQLELKQKMTLTEPQNAIYNYKGWGPRFGGGDDLCIADKSNQNQQSWSNFPDSYNCKGKYQRNQQSSTAFCGNPNSKRFRVYEWQVFAVVN